jgi:hypothetical protein
MSKKEILELFAEGVESLGNNMFKIKKFKHRIKEIENFIGVKETQELFNHIKEIGSWIDLNDSQITSLGKLESIGGYADFSDSQITSLGNLKRIGGFAFFIRSQIKSLGNLKSIANDAFFNESHITSLGNLKSIGRNADFKDSKINDLGNLKSIGGDAYFCKSKTNRKLLKNTQFIPATRSATQTLTPRPANACRC